MTTEDNLLMSTCPVVDSTLVAIYWEKKCENFWSLMNGENLQLAKIRDIPQVSVQAGARERTSGKASILSFSVEKLHNVRGLFKGDSC